MSPSKLHPVMAELAKTAVTKIEDTGCRLASAIERLEEEDLLGALGALAGCGATIQSTVLVIDAAHTYQQLVNRSAGELFAPSEAQPEESPATPCITAPESPDAHSEKKRES